MKRFIVWGLLMFCVTWASAQDKLKVAVFDPAISGKVFDEGAGVVVREIVSSTLVNSGKYTIIERSLIDKILSEQKFSNSGAVDDSQVSELGKLAGADKVVLSVMSSAGARGMLSLKVIDVTSASIESQKTQLAEPNKVYDVIESMTMDLVGMKPAATATAQSSGGGGAAALLSLSGMFGRGGKNRGAEAAEEEEVPVVKKSAGKTGKERMVALMEGDEEEIELPAQPRAVPAGDKIVLFFDGSDNLKKDPDAKIYVDGKLIGRGSGLNGFNVTFADTGERRRNVKIEWSDTVATSTYTVDVKNQKEFEFEYTRGGFGYEFRLKK